jgi:hypothetical protein
MLTTAQLQTFKTAILGDGNLTAFLSAGDMTSIAAYYNSPGTGFIWLPSITTSLLNDAIVWSEFASLTVAQQNTYMAMIVVGTVDATQANIRTGFSTIFSGKTTLSNLTALAQRVPTRFESLFTLSNVCSLFGYQVSANDVDMARSS